jgi:threonine aldolase
MIGWFAGCMPRPLASSNGVLTWPQIRAAVRPVSPHWAPTGLIEIENTHNMGGGTVYPLDTVHEICEGAHALGLKVHMDGARVFNAAAALGVPVSEIAAPVDTVMFCLSKALGAPVGSMLAGPADDIARGRLYRKRLGGGMRQAGVLAAAGLIALEEHPAKLAEDHRNARFMAESLAKLPGFRTEPSAVQTNIVMVDVTGTGFTAPEFSRRLRERAVIMNPVNDREVRIVTHYDVSRGDCERAVQVMAEVAAETEVARGVAR